MTCSQYRRDKNYPSVTGQSDILADVSLFYITHIWYALEHLFEISGVSRPKTRYNIASTILAVCYLNSSLLENNQIENGSEKAQYVAGERGNTHGPKQELTTENEYEQKAHPA